MLANLFLSLLVLATAPADKLFRKGSKNPLVVTVVSEDYATVKYRPQGVNQNVEIRSDLVDRIEYDDAPEAYTSGLKFLAANDFSNAANSLKLALKSATKNNWIKVHGNYQLGIAHFRWGAKDKSQYGEAAKAFEACVQAEPNSRMASEALKHWGKSLSFAGNARGAAKVFDQFVQDARTKKLGIELEAEGLIEKADAYAANDLPTEATEAYREAGNFAQANSEAQKDSAVKAALDSIRARAQMSQGDALLHAKKYADAQRFFEQVARDGSASPQAIAGALCGLGEVKLAEKQLAEAIDQFAAVKVKYHLVRGQAARATFLLGECYLQREDDPNGKRKATEYFKEVTERYPDSPWAARARAKIQ